MRLERSRVCHRVSEDGLHATLLSPQGEHWLTLVLGAASTVSASSTRHWRSPRRSRTEIPSPFAVSRPRGATPALRLRRAVARNPDWVEGDGRLTDVHLLAGRLLLATKAPGLHPSGSSFRTLFSPNPGDPSKLVRAATESAVLGTMGDGALGRATGSSLLRRTGSRSPRRTSLRRRADSWRLAPAGLAAPPSELGSSRPSTARPTARSTSCSSTKGTQRCRAASRPRRSS